MRSTESTMPPWAGTAPPDSPLPAPRGVTGMRSRFANFMIAAISPAEIGRTSASGMWAYCESGVSSCE